MPGKTARSPDQTSFGTAGTPEATAQPTCGFPGTPPSAIVYTVPEFIWEMSDTINPGHAQMNSIFNPPLVIPSAATVDTVKRLYGGRSTEG